MSGPFQYHASASAMTRIGSDAFVEKVSEALQSELSSKSKKSAASTHFAQIYRHLNPGWLPEVAGSLRLRGESEGHRRDRDSVGRRERSFGPSVGRARTRLENQATVCSMRGDLVSSSFASGPQPSLAVTGRHSASPIEVDCQQHPRVRAV